MSGDARRPLAEEERARARLTKAYGLTCGTCGKPLAADETVWVERVGVGPAYNGRGAIYWRAPVCGACVSPATRAATAGADPRRCAGCGRGVYSRADRRSRGVALCSRECGRRHQAARMHERRESLPRPAHFGIRGTTQPPTGSR